MSVQALGWVLDHSTAEGACRLVLISIANHAGEKDHLDEAWPSIGTIARETRIHPDTVKRLIRQLHDAGHITRGIQECPDQRIPERYRPNLYTIHRDHDLIARLGSERGGKLPKRRGKAAKAEAGVISDPPLPEVVGGDLPSAGGGDLPSDKGVISDPPKPSLNHQVENQENPPTPLEPSSLAGQSFAQANACAARDEFDPLAGLFDDEPAPTEPITEPAPPPPDGAQRPKRKPRGPAKTYPEEFERWWKIYPKGDDKADAAKAFAAALRSGADLGQLMLVAERYRAYADFRGEENEDYLRGGGRFLRNGWQDWLDGGSAWVRHQRAVARPASNGQRRRVDPNAMLAKPDDMVDMMDVR